MECGYKPVRIAIIGTGNVGATFAFALLNSGLAGEIVLIDANPTKAEGEAMDLNHAVPFMHPTRIWAGSYQDCANASIIVITAGTGQKPGETRLDLVHRNVDIFKKIVPEIAKYNTDGVILVATNPVDILTYAAWKLSGFPAQRVLGSGTILDTARFRYMIGQYTEVDPRSVHAYIIGEHGDSEVPVWSLTNIAGMQMEQYCRANCKEYRPEIMQDIFQQTRDAAYHIIERKGSTYYAIANGLLRILESILRNQDTVLSVSTYLDGSYGLSDLYLSVPVVVGSNGIKHQVNLLLSDKEMEDFQKSAKVISDTIDATDLRNY